MLRFQTKALKMQSQLQSPRRLLMLVLLPLLCASLADGADRASPQAPSAGLRRSSAARRSAQEASTQTGFSGDLGAHSTLLQSNKTGYVVAWGDLQWVGTPPITTQADIVKISAGGYHALALTSKGKVIAWGDNTWHQATVPDEAATNVVVDVAAGDSHSLVLLRDGTVLAWGDNSSGECNVPAELRNGSVKASAIAAGSLVSVALVEGGVRVWGDNTTGTLGAPSEARSGVVAIAVGADAVLAQKANGTLIQWGSFSGLPSAIQKGALMGPGTFDNGWDQNVALGKDGGIAVWKAGDPSYQAIWNQVSTPPSSMTAGTYTNISAGYNFTLALSTGGEVVAWGYDGGTGVLSVPAAARSNVLTVSAGAYGFGLALVAGSLSSMLPASPTLPPVPAPAATTGHVYAWGDDSFNETSGVPPDALTDGIIKISAGRTHALALTANGQVLGWGSDNHGQTSALSQHMRTATAIDISAGEGLSMAVLSNGTVRAWGNNTYHQCDVPDFGGVKVTNVSAGRYHSLALLENGTVVTWGVPPHRQDFNQTHVPPAAKSGIVAIAAGPYGNLAVDSNGTLIQWGDNDDPPDVVKQKGVSTAAGSISVGLDHLVAILTDGTVAVWYMVDPFYVSLQAQVVAAPLGRAVYVSAGTNFTAAVMETGKVVVWGAPSTALSLGSIPDSQALQVAAGAWYAIALVADPPMPTGRAGLLMAWGSNIPVDRPDGDDDVPVVKASAGAEHVMELLANGTVRVWGNPPDVRTVPIMDGQAVVDIAAGQGHCLALLRNGTVVAWGDDTYGQATLPSSLQQTSNQVNYLSPDGRDVHNTSQPLKASATQVPKASASGGYSHTNMSTRVVAIAAGYYHSLALLSNGTVVAWGLQIVQETTPPGNISGNVTAIAAGAETSFALLRKGSDSNGTGLIGWGAAGQLPDAAVHSAVSVAGGLDHSVAILQNGSAIAWPSSYPVHPALKTQLTTVPDSVQNAAGVAASSYHSIALLASGQVVTWGAADSSTLTVPAAVAGHKVLQVAAGPNYTLALVDVDPAGMQQLNTAPGCDPSANQFGLNPLGYKCNRDISSQGDKWQLSYTVSISPVPPKNPCTKGITDDASSHQLPAQATHWVHFLLSSTASGWIALSYPDDPTKMSPAKAILGYGDGTDRSFINTYTFTNYSLPAPDNDSWAINMGATTINDHTVICFTQAASLKNSTHSSRRLHQTGPDKVLDLSKDLSFQIASSTGPNVTQIHTFVGGVALGLTSGNVTGVNLTPKVIPNVTQAPAPAPSAPSADREASSPSTGLTSGAIAGIAIGAVSAAAIVVGLIALWLYKRKQDQRWSLAYQASGKYEYDTGKDTQGPGPEGVAGLLEGDAFLAATAKKYGWTTQAALEGPLQAVEAGVNDMQLDTLVKERATEAGEASAGVTSTAVQLSRDELRENVQLLSDGLLGRGATALVFKCLWPSRFGPNALLAAKVVKDGFDGDMMALESFTYEANVLASAQHENIVRLYGYCLEPPTLCLILELLPTSLKDVLYKGMPYPLTTGSFHPSKYSPPTLTSVGLTGSHSMGHTGAHSTGLTGSHSMGHTRTEVTPGALTAGPSTRFTQPGTGTTDEAHVVIEVATDGVVEVNTTTGNCDKTAEMVDSAKQPGTDATTSVPQPKLTCLQVVRLATDIAAGLAYLHSSDLPTETMEEEMPTVMSDSTAGTTLGRSRIVHRDMKPANILINSKGVAKISDFGLARQHEHTTVATVHLGVGTLPYMAPELLVGARAGAYGQAVTNRVDIYSLAMMMWEMISSRPPWKDMGEMAILAAVSQRQRPPLPGDVTFKDTAALQEVAHQPASPAAIPQLNKLIRACWNQRDLKRPQAREVYAKLVALLADMQGPKSMPTSSPTVTITDA